MLFRKYQLVVFRDQMGACRKIRMRGWVLFFVLFFVLVLGAGNVVLWKYYRDYTRIERTLSLSEKTVQEQKTQLLSLAQKMKNIQMDLSRIRDFDSKLRVMINLDQGKVQNVTPLGGTTTVDFSKNYLPLYRQELLARKMHEFLRQLNTEARVEEVRQQELIHTLRTNQNLLEATPSIWPTEGWVSSSFGWRTSPFTGKREFHKGLDISCPLGTPIYAPSRGTVIFNGSDGSYGRTVKLDHGSGMVTRYGHMHRIEVKDAQVITRGELIGYVGNTGRSTGPHLHYEVRLNGVPVNPMRYILN